MNKISQTVALLCTLAAGSQVAVADDPIALDLVTSGNSVAFEFVVQLPKGATNVDLSSCLKGLPASHKGQCVHHEKSGEVIAIAFSTENAKLPSGALALGNVRYTSLLKGGAAATIRDLVVADGLGKTVQSEVQTEDALLGN
jgi:hypothetical protein